MDVRTTPLFTVTLKVAKIQNLGRTPLGERRIGIVAGGSFEGPKLSGTVEETASEDMLHRQLTEEELLRALTSEAQRRAEPQPEDTGDYEE